MRPVQQHENELVTIDVLNGKFEMSIDPTAEPLIFHEYEFPEESIGQRQSRFSDLDVTHEDQIAKHMKEDRRQANEADNDKFLRSF